MIRLIVMIELDDMNVTSAETKATYDEIKKYVAEHNDGIKVSNLYISHVNCVEFEAIKSEAGLNSFVLTPKRWVETTNAIGIVTKGGRYAATYAHKDIAFEFASWISPEFKLYIIEDYQRLKEGENARLSLSWNLNREISKLNYRIHTDAIKENLIPPILTPQQISYTYASEADLLNTVLFGKTAKEWRDINPGEKGNIREDTVIT